DAGSAGNFADGITLWTGSGDDVIEINGTHRRDDVREITTLNTGLGNDHVTVHLDAATDGFFVLNTQGPTNDQPTAPDDAVVTADGSTLPLIILGGQGDDLITGGDGNDLIFGDRGRVTYFDGINPVTVLGNGGPGDHTDGVERPLGEALSQDAVGGDDTASG